MRSFERTVTNARIQVDQGEHTHASLHPVSSIQRLGLGTEQQLVHFHIEANAFLRCMVRAIAGTLLEIGKGKMPPEKMQEVIDAKDRSAAGPNLPARGLCLIRVGYA